MPRALWKGHISFGLVEIPVMLRSAERREGEISFKLFDRRDHSPVGNLRVNKNTGEEVPWEQVVKGYEHEPGEVVLVSESELASANVEATHAIEILDFVDASEITPLFWSDPYYVLPARSSGQKAWALLRETLRRTGRVGIANVVLRTRQHLAALTVEGPAMVLDLLRYAHELVDPATLELPPASAADVPARELEMATKLVESMSAEWKPEKYRDTWHRDVMALIERKVRSGKVEPVEEPEAEPREKEAPVLDLMPLLKQSVESQSGRRPARAGAARARPRTEPRSRSRTRARAPRTSARAGARAARRKTA
jgi:DNA end-binding protein Ku